MKVAAVNEKARRLAALADELRHILRTTPLDDLQGEQPDTYVMRLVAAGYRAMAQGLEDEARWIDDDMTARRTSR